MKRFAGIGVLLLVVSAVMAAPIEPGRWFQTSSTAGDCADCSLAVEAPSPHLRTVVASNGWVAFLRYEPARDRYVGFMELTRAPLPGTPDWRGMVFEIEAVVDAQTLTLTAVSGQSGFGATYRLR